MSEEALLRKCLTLIEDRLGWGPAERWSNADFEVLSERIGEVTSVTLSATTLKRVWGRVAYTSQPSTTTLDVLAQFAGFDNYRAFRSHRLNSTREEPKARQAPPVQRSRFPRYALLLLPVLAVGGLLIALLPGTTVPPAPPPQKFSAEDFSFDFRPVTDGIPNSVVFTYDATAAGDAEVYLQQSWDPNRREQLDAKKHVHTSIYYLPGFYEAKLVVGDQVVRERELLLPSDGWIAAVDGEASPVYLSARETLEDGQLSITEEILSDYGIALQPDVPSTALMHVGGLDSIYTDNFTLKTRFRQTYRAGSAACRLARVSILLKGDAIQIPFSAPGCVADLSLYGVGQNLDGRTHDLSALGVMGDDWTELSVTGTGDGLEITIGGQQVFHLDSPDEPIGVIGWQYDFAGTGAVDYLWVERGRVRVFDDQF